MKSPEGKKAREELIGEHFYKVDPDRKRQGKFNLLGGNMNVDVVVQLAKGVVTKGEIVHTEKGEKASPRTMLKGYTSYDEFGSIAGSRAMMSATEVLHDAFPQAKILTMSTVEFKKDGKIFKVDRHARVAKELLTRRKKVPEEIIEAQEESNSTFTEILELIKRMVENDWQNAVVIASEMQLDRAKLQLEYFDEMLKKKRIIDYVKNHKDSAKFIEALKTYKASRENFHIRLVSAEEVLTIEDERYSKKVFEKMRKTPAYAITLANEKKGMSQILDGTYWGPSMPHDATEA